LKQQQGGEGADKFNLKKRPPQKEKGEGVSPRSENKTKFRTFIRDQKHGAINCGEKKAPTAKRGGQKRRVVLVPFRESTALFAGGRNGAGREKGDLTQFYEKKEREGLERPSSERNGAKRSGSKRPKTEMEGV